MLLGFELGLGCVYLWPFAEIVQPSTERIEQETAAFEELELLTHSHSGELGLPLVPQLPLIALLVVYPRAYHLVCFLYMFY